MFNLGQVTSITEIEDNSRIGVVCVDCEVLIIDKRSQKGEGSCSTKYLCDLTERGIKVKRLRAVAEAPGLQESATNDLEMRMLPKCLVRVPATRSSYHCPGPAPMQTCDFRDRRAEKNSTDVNP